MAVPCKNQKVTHTAQKGEYLLSRLAISPEIVYNLAKNIVSKTANSFNASPMVAVCLIDIDEGGLKYHYLPPTDIGLLQLPAIYLAGNF